MGACALVVYLCASGGGFVPEDYGWAGFSLWSALALVLVFGPMPAARPSSAMYLVLYAFGGLVAWSALGLLWTESVGRTVDELDRLAVLGGVLALVAWGLRRDSFRAAAAGLAMASIGVAAIAVFFRLVPDLAPDAARVPSIAGGRLAFPIEYWNGLAGVCAMAVCAGIGWGAHGASTGVRGAALASVPISGLALYLTFSRGGLIALACGVAALVALSREPRATMRVALVGLAAAAVAALAVRPHEDLTHGTGDAGGASALLVVALLALACWVWAMRRHAKRDGGGRLGSKVSWAIAAMGVAVSVAIGVGVSGEATRAGPLEGDPTARLASLETNRTELWRVALDMFQEDPLTGTGAGTYGLHLSHDPEVTDLAADAHSLPLESAGELGSVGLLLLAAFVVGLWRAAWLARKGLEASRDRTAATVMLAFGVVFGVQALFDWVWELTAVAVLGIGALAGLAAAGSSASRHRVRARWRALAAAVCVAVSAAQVPGVVSAERAEFSEEALAAGFPTVAAEAAADATTAAPWSARAHAQRARAALVAGDLELARAEADDAIELEPTNWEHRVLSAQIAAESRDSAGAREALTEAGRLRPAVRAITDALARNPLSLASSSDSDAP